MEFNFSKLHDALTSIIWYWASSGVFDKCYLPSIRMEIKC